jgi:anionic cell wall polymer biosynthesis LytR-Cps2A-Psr (LCP) family protein
VQNGNEAQNGLNENIDFGDAPKQSQGKFTRREGVYNFLVAGIDAEGGNHTDVLLIVSYDTADGSAAVLSIPRDTYINVGRNFSKLNSYYTGEYNVAVKNGLRGSEARRAAMDGLAKLLEENLAIKLDYWAMMDLEGFRNIVDNHSFSYCCPVSKTSLTVSPVKGYTKYPSAPACVAEMRESSFSARM